MGLPTLSVLLPNRNHARFLPESLSAILSQSWPAHEMIILDDASTDDSLAVIKELTRGRAQVRIERNESRRGVVGAITQLLALAQGDCVLLAAADDRVLPDFFHKAMTLLAAHPNAGLCSGLTVTIDEAGRETGLLRLPIATASAGYLDPDRCLQEFRRRGSWISGCCTIYRRQALLAAGGVLPELGPFYDGFIQKVIALRQGACFIPEPLACWRIMETSYAHQLSSSIDQSRALFEQAARLMRTTYADVFPEEYPTSFLRQKLFLLGYQQICSVTSSWRQGALATFAGLFPTGSVLESALIRIAGCMLQGCVLSLCCLLAGRLRVDPEWLLCRTIGYLNHALQFRLGRRWLPQAPQATHRQ